MTICSAAFADNEQAIVCIADKGVSYGDTIQWDSDNSKILNLGSRNAVVMLAGGDSHITRVLAPLLEKESEIGKSVQGTIKLCEQEYKTALDDLVTLNFLHPRLLTREDYIKGLSGDRLNEFFRGVATEIDEFPMNCALMLCGFDSEQRPFVISLENPGVGTNFAINGFHAIGTGWEKAISRFLYSEYKRTNPIERILYDLFDAKAFAEMNSSVGYEWDAKIVTAEKIWEVPPHIRKLLEQVWAKFNRSPFQKREPDDLKNPPRDWHEQLNVYFSKMTGRIPRGKMRTVMASGAIIEREQTAEVKEKMKLVKKLLPKPAKRSGARKSKQAR
jgi:hypothetical protein